MEQIQAEAARLLAIALDYLINPGVLFQLGLIALLFLPALLLSKRVEPRLEERARRIKGMPDVLRVIVAFLRRLEWLFFIILVGLAYLATSIAEWPGE